MPQMKCNNLFRIAMRRALAIVKQNIYSMEYPEQEHSTQAFR